MEAKDLELIQKLLNENEDLARLWAEHQKLEAKLDALASRVYLSAEEQVEVKRLKKIKLAGRDRMEAILAEYRQRQSA